MKLYINIKYLTLKSQKYVTIIVCIVPINNIILLLKADSIFKIYYLNNNIILDGYYL